MQRAFIIGWDGATFDLIRPWVEEGKLPVIAKILEEGSHGALRSTMPPMTFPAWTSFMTGVNPGKHGIFDFTRRRPGKYELEFVNGGQRRAPSLWHILSQAGRRVISVSVPCTFPPEPVNGVMISGFDVPGLGGAGMYVDARGMHPPELWEELNRQVGGHPISAFMIADINHGRPDLGLAKNLEVIRQKAATAKYLMANRPWDCFMILFGESDGIGHHYWKYCDPNSPLFVDRPEDLRDSILRVYQELDRQTGEMLKLLPEGTTVLMMSDHGFGGLSHWMLYPNCWLAERKLLRLRGGAAHWRSRVLNRLKLWAVATLPGGVKRALYRFSRTGLGGIESRVRHGIIDWSRTEAYFEENPYYPAVWVNLRGRQPRGTVEPGRHYEEVRDRLIQELAAWRHPETGEAVVERAYRREEVYSGPCLEEAPDVVVKWGLCRGYGYMFRLSSKSRQGAWIEPFDAHGPESRQYFTGQSGHHRDDGIFLAHGPTIRGGRAVTGARIIDLAPTILHLLGVPVPADMDGRVLEEIFTDAFAQAGPVLRAGAEGVSAATGTGGGYSPEDEDAIAARLRSLGYVE
jgi:predicted AlkP superfamily phosphohydrolase/phosphomutase